MLVEPVEMKYLWIFLDVLSKFLLFLFPKYLCKSLALLPCHSENNKNLWLTTIDDDWWLLSIKHHQLSLNITFIATFNRYLIVWFHWLMHFKHSKESDSSISNTLMSLNKSRMVAIFLELQDINMADYGNW